MAQSIKLGNDTYVDESDVMLDSSSSSRETIAQARSPVIFTVTFPFTPTNAYQTCYYNALTKEVHLNILVYSSSQSIPGQNGTIATIPAEYRPRGVREAFANVTTTDNTSVKVERVLIDTAGKIYCTNFLVGQNMRVFALNVTYFIG